MDNLLFLQFMQKSDFCNLCKNPTRKIEPWIADEKSVWRFWQSRVQNAVQTGENYL